MALRYCLLGPLTLVYVLVLVALLLEHEALRWLLEHAALSMCPLTLVYVLVLVALLLFLLLCITAERVTSL